MEREGISYVYVAICIHIGPAGMGTSLCDCVSVHMYIEVIGKDCQERLQLFSFKRSKLEREREQELTNRARE